MEFMERFNITTNSIEYGGYLFTSKMYLDYREQPHSTY